MSAQLCLPRFPRRPARPLAVLVTCGWLASSWIPALGHADPSPCAAGLRQLQVECAAVRPGSGLEVRCPCLEALRGLPDPTRCATDDERTALALARGAALGRLAGLRGSDCPSRGAPARAEGAGTSSPPAPTTVGPRPAAPARPPAVASPARPVSPPSPGTPRPAPGPKPPALAGPATTASPPATGKAKPSPSLVAVQPSTPASTSPQAPPPSASGDARPLAGQPYGLTHPCATVDKLGAFTGRNEENQTKELTCHPDLYRKYLEDRLDQLLRQLESSAVAADGPVAAPLATSPERQLGELLLQYLAMLANLPPAQQTAETSAWLARHTASAEGVLGLRQDDSVRRMADYLASNQGTLDRMRIAPDLPIVLAISIQGGDPPRREQVRTLVEANLVNERKIPLSILDLAQLGDLQDMLRSFLVVSSPAVEEAIRYAPMNLRAPDFLLHLQLSGTGTIARAVLYHLRSALKLEQATPPAPGAAPGGSGELPAWLDEYLATIGATMLLQPSLLHLLAPRIGLKDLPVAQDEGGYLVRLLYQERWQGTAPAGLHLEVPTEQRTAWVDVLGQFGFAVAAGPGQSPTLRVDAEQKGTVWRASLLTAAGHLLLDLRLEPTTSSAATTDPTRAPAAATVLRYLEAHTRGLRLYRPTKVTNGRLEEDCSACEPPAPCPALDCSDCPCPSLDCSNCPCPPRAGVSVLAPRPGLTLPPLLVSSVVPGGQLLAFPELVPVAPAARPWVRVGGGALALAAALAVGWAAASNEEMVDRYAAHLRTGDPDDFAAARVARDRRQALLLGLAVSSGVSLAASAAACLLGRCEPGEHEGAPAPPAPGLLEEAVAPPAPGGGR